MTSRLEEIQAEARTIATFEEPDVLPTWRPYFESVRLAADDLAGAEDLASAARLTAALGGRCARCHQAAAAHIVFRDEPQPDPGVKLATTMAGHHWAARRLWEGLIGPSHERWREGAEMLSRAPLTIVAEDPDRPSGIADDVARVRLFAKRALAAQDLDARTSLYGEILSTCSHCHAVIRDR